MRWIVKFSIMLIIVGVLLGLAVSTLNPWKSSAEAKRMNMETTHQQRLYELEEQLALAKTETEIQAIEQQRELLVAQIEHEKQVMAQDLINRQRLTDAWIASLPDIGIALMIGLILYALILAVSNFISAPAVKSNHAHLEVPGAAGQSMQGPLKDYHREYLELKSESRELKHKNEHLETRNKQLSETNHKLARLCELLAAEKNFDVEKIVRNMKNHRDPAKTMKGEYEEKPLAGD